jgi:UDPglucose 6-dehydrogenase
MRDSPAIAIIQSLQDAGATIRAFDPEGMELAKPLLGQVVYCEGPYEAVEGADGVAIVTEWNEFRSLDLERVRSLLKSPVLVDLRNIYRPEEMEKVGLSYSSIGR